MVIRNVPNKPQRGLISITLDKKSFDFRSQRMESNALFVSWRDAILLFDRMRMVMSF